MNLLILWSLAVSALFLFGLYRIQRRPLVAVQAYRWFLLVFLAAWSSALWLRPYRPTLGLAFGSLLMGAAPFLLALVPPRTPKNRHETKGLLDLRQTDRRLERYWTASVRRIYWATLALLVWSICYRVAMVFSG